LKDLAKNKGPRYPDDEESDYSDDFYSDDFYSDDDYSDGDYSDDGYSDDDIDFTFTANCYKGLDYTMVTVLRERWKQDPTREHADWNIERDLESIETTAAFLHSTGFRHYCKKVIFQLRKIMEKQRQAGYQTDLPPKGGRCHPTAACMDWAGWAWRRGGGCRRGCGGFAIPISAPSSPW
jgi:hypothetical protein